MRSFISRLFVLFVLLLCMITAGWAQSGRMSYKHSIHNFGVFNEGKNARWDFTFTNTGSDSLTITSVHAQCGCTTPSYNHEPVAPGRQGNVIIIYHSESRPGPFEKEVVITTNGEPATVKVRIKGNVLPRPLKGNDVKLIGGIRFSDGTINMDTVSRGEPAKYILHFQNASPHPIRILELKHPRDVEAYYPPFTILTGEMMRVTVTFIPDKSRPKGLIRDSLLFKTTDSVKPDKVIYLTAFIASKGKAKRNPVPELVFKKDLINLGTVLQHDTARVAFHFTNKGSDTLHITDVQTSCGCTIAKLKKKSYAPGESGVINIFFDAGDKFGEIQKEIMVASNDPSSPKIQLILRSKVVLHPGKNGSMATMSSANESIFSGRCRSCHVDKGLGKKGEALFAADCQLCHGRVGKSDSVFHPGPALDSTFLSTFDRKVLFKRIAEGTTNPHKRQMMPGFMKKFGGPLTAGQVASLVYYLQSVKISNK